MTYYTIRSILFRLSEPKVLNSHKNSFNYQHLLRYTMIDDSDESKNRMKKKNPNKNQLSIYFNNKIRKEFVVSEAYKLCMNL